MATLPDGRIPVLLSSHADDLIRADAQAVLAYLDCGATVADVAGHLVATRRVRRHRVAIRAADHLELADGLRAAAAGEEHPLVARSGQSGSVRVAFVFPGQGNQWPSMGAEAYRHLPAYRAAVDRCVAEFDRVGLTSPLDYLTTAADPASFSEIEVEGAQFVHAVGLALLWQSCGIAPHTTVGHSLGEIAAAHIAGAITLAEAVAVVAARAGVVGRLPGRYAVAALGIGVDAARDLIAATPGWLELSVINSASSVAVSGDRDAVSAAVQKVTAGGLFGREITVNFPVHTSVLEPLREDLIASLPVAEFICGSVQFIAGSTGAVVSPGTPFGEYWYRNLRDTVRFDRAIAAAITTGVTAFIEMSAHPALLYAMGELLDELPGGPAVLVGSGRRGEPVVDQLSANIVSAAVALPGYAWRSAVTAPRRHLAEFPNAPMRAVPMWATPDPLPAVASLTIAAEVWQQIPMPAASTTPRRLAFVDLGSSSPLIAALRTAVEAHPRAAEALAADADVIVVVAPPLELSDAPLAAVQLAELVGAGLLGYVDAIGPHCRDVWLVTAGGEQVRADEPVALPAQAALAAMHRAVGFEFPDQDFHHLDLGTGCTATVLDAVLGTAGEIAVRSSGDGDVLYRRELVDHVPAEPAWVLDSGVLDSVVIIGAGAIGMHYARYLAERGAKRIVLLSRTGADPAALAALTERYGTEVAAPSCDITRSEQVAAAAAEFSCGGASLVIHAAGSAHFAERDAVTARDFADTVTAKITGLAHVAALWPAVGDTRVILCSSVAGVWGGKGAAAYAAANRMLDVMAAQLRATGLRCVSVRWGLWGSAGVLDATETARGERAGLRPMAPLLALESSLYDYSVDPLILSADPDRLRLLFESHRASAKSAVIKTTDTAGAVRVHLAAVLAAPDALELDLDASLFDLGIDSLLALDLRKRLTQATGRTVKLAKLLSGITGHELVGVLDRAESPERVTLSRD